MSKLYDRAFKVGFIGTVVFFALLNIPGFIRAHQEYLACLDDPVHKLWTCDRGNWGFPFAWKDHPVEDALYGLVLNFAVIAGCGFAGGFLVRAISRQFGVENR
jgi:hypothetical protein